MAGAVSQAGAASWRRIESAAESVVSDDFFARGRPKLAAGLRFEFDHQQYVEAIAAIPDAPAFRPPA